MTTTCTNCEARPNPGDTQCQTCLVTIAMTSTVRTALNVYLQDHPNPLAVIEPLRKAVRAIAEMGMAGYPANADKNARFGGRVTNTPPFDGSQAPAVADEEEPPTT